MPNQRFQPTAQARSAWAPSGLRPSAAAEARHRGGTFDDPQWFEIEWHTWLRSAHPWVMAPPGVEKFQENAIQQPKAINYCDRLGH